jgi:CRISPR-associated protein Csm1
LNSFEFLENSHLFSKQLFPVQFGFRLVGNYAPSKGGNLLDFEAISKLTTGIPNYPDPIENPIYPQLAVVRLDVDDLGCLFANGFSNNSDLRKVAALSRELHLFFSGHFNELAKKYNIYVVYSGGDDAFAVGNWCSMLHFIGELQMDFKSFTNNHTDLHFSAGVLMCDEHYPVAMFAESAGALEKKAKKSHENKNRVSIYNHELPFESFNNMVAFGERILAYTSSDDKEKSGKLTKSFVYRVLSLIRSSFHERRKIVNGEVVINGSVNMENYYRNLARFKNYLARNEFTSEIIEKASDELTKDIIKSFVTAWDNESEGLLKDYTIALHYALYRTRKSKN